MVRTVGRGFEEQGGWRLLLAGASLALLGILAPVQAASAGVPAQGSVSMVIGSGKAGKALAGAGVRVSSANAEVPQPLEGGRVRLGFPVKDVAISKRRSVVSLVGSLVFSRGAERTTIGKLSFVSTGKGSFVEGRLGGSVERIFETGRSAEVDEQVGTVAIKGRKTVLTRGAARRLASSLGIPGIPVARIGKTSTSEVQGAFEDPYGELCSLPATSKVAGTLPEAGPAPAFEGTTVAEGLDVPWGFRSGFRNYLHYLPDSQGVMQGIDGASVVPNPVPSLAPTGFKWGFDSGKFDPASTEGATDRVVLEGSGTILLCHKTQFRINLSDPEIVIDGLRAQLIFDVDTNVLGDWIPSQRIALANLITSEGTRTQDATSITWTNVPVVLTAAGSDALRLAPFSPTFRYQAGQALQTITFTVTSDTPA